MEETTSGFYTYEERWGRSVRKGYDVVGFYRRWPGLKIGYEIPLERENGV